MRAGALETYPTPAPPPFPFPSGRIRALPSSAPLPAFHDPGHLRYDDDLGSQSWPPPGAGYGRAALVLRWGWLIRRHSLALPLRECLQLRFRGPGHVS